MPKAAADPIIKTKDDTRELVRRVRAARNAEAEAFHAENEPRMGRILLQHLRALYPTADMDVLARYGLTTTAERLRVRIFDPDTKRWHASVSVALPDPVRVPRDRDEIGTAAPWFRDPEAGVTPGYWTSMEAGERQKYLADCADRLRHSVPDEAEGYFVDLLARSKALKAETEQAEGFVAAFRAEHGRPPRWSDAAVAFPGIEQ